MIDYQEVLDNLFDGVYVVTRQRKITYWNKTAELMTGYSAEEVAGSHCYDGTLRHVDVNGINLCKDGCPLAWAMAHKCKHEAELFLHHKDGHRVPVKIRISPVFDSNGQVSGAVELFTDKTPHEGLTQRVAELETLAMLDPLTQLANKQYLENQVVSYAKELNRTTINIGFLLIAIDDYEDKFAKLSTCSSSQFQKIVGETLKLNSRPLDVVGRLEDGLFVCLLRNVTSNQLYTIAEKLRNLVGNSYASSGDHVMQGTVSIGGTILKKDDSMNSVLNRCQKQLAECLKLNGNKANVELHFR
jgi:diguanylate cyclase (GGDEF)-like protein/PAS domain S-box-containing protein